MNRIDTIRKHQSKLNKQYKELMEEAYNFRQIDSALSDISEFKAVKLLNRLNELNFLSREKSSHQL